MEPISSIVGTALSTLLGKVVAGAAATAVTAAGMHGAGVVELPLPDLGDEPAVVETEGEPADQADIAEEEKAAAEEEKAASEDEDDGVLAEDEQLLDDETAGDGESQGIGEDVSTMAKDGGVDGHTVAEMAPGAAHRPDHAGAPEDPGSQAPAERGSQAPAEAGSQADTAPRGDDAGEIQEEEIEEESDEDAELEADSEAGAQGRGNAPSDAGSED